jgi:4'-phosphopantetheinyl transferase
MSIGKQRLELAEGQVDLWLCAPPQLGSGDSLRAYVELLSAEERERYQRLKFPQHQREYLASHALLRTALSLYAEPEPAAWQFLRNEFGKPAIANPLAAPLQFNLSHTSGLTLCAIGRGADIGADVEFHANSQALLEVADHYFSEREIIDLRALPAAEQGDAFFRYWTLKESYIKARGEGLSIPLDSFSFYFDADQRIRFELAGAPPADGERWTFALFPLSASYTAAVALQCERADFRLFWSTLDSYEQLVDASHITDYLE